LLVDYNGTSSNKKNEKIKVIISGALGYISKPLTGLMVKKGQPYRGTLEEDYRQHKGALLGNMQLEDFVKEFAAALANNK
jgi:hypothetical protein